MSQKKIKTCADCGDCCTYLALEIDTPTSKKDYSDLFWHLMHRNVSIFIDHDKKWHIEFETLCEGLDENKRCRIYEDRPLICRKYSIDACTKHSSGKYFVHKFNTPSALKRYLARKGIDYRFKRMPA